MCRSPLTPDFVCFTWAALFRFEHRPLISSVPPVEAICYQAQQYSLSNYAEPELWPLRGHYREITYET